MAGLPFDSPIALATLEAGMVVDLPDDDTYRRYVVVTPINLVLVRDPETGEGRCIGAGDGARLVETWNCRPDSEFSVPVGG